MAAFVSHYLFVAVAPGDDPPVELVGNVSGKVALIIEDIVDTGKTTTKAVEALKGAGATKVFAYATHALLSGNAVDTLQVSALDKIVVLDTVPVPADKMERCPKLEQISIAGALAQTIRRLHYQRKSNASP